MARHGSDVVNGKGDQDQDFAIESHTPMQSVILHLTSGLLIVAFFLLFSPIVVGAGYPALVALFVAIPLVLVPIELGIPYYRARSRGVTFAELLPYRESLSLRQYAAFTIGLSLWSLIAIAVLFPLDEWLLGTAFDWIPPEYQLTTGMFELEGTILIITFVLVFLFNVIIGPVVEEVYFRGYLLPRIPTRPAGRPVVNTVLFSVYHFWSPWQILSRMVSILPFVGTVWWKRNIYLGVLVHCLVNTVGILGLLAFALGRPPV